MSAIKKANEILRRGHVPCRGDEEYKKKNSWLFACFPHACYNFTNEQLDEFDIGSEEFLLYNPFGFFNTSSIETTKSEMLGFLKKTGLQVERYHEGKILKANQWKVAMYFSESYKRDFGQRGWHFLLQEKDGSWSGKNGGSVLVEKFEKPERFIPWDLNNRYEFNDLLVLTNPYAKEK